MKTRMWIVIGSILIIALIIGLIIVVSSDNEPINNDIVTNYNEQEQNATGAPSKIDENEKDVSKNKREELFNFIPKVFIEGIAPFDSSFMLDAVMSKIIDINENYDFSVENVDNMVKKIFGKDDLYV